MDYRTATSLGARLRAARRARGMRTTRDLADAIGDGNVTESIIENIESGRKAFLDVSHLLNIAMALQVPPSYLLAPLGRPSDRLDLANLSSAFDNMTAAEFDLWLSGTSQAVLPPRSALERAAQLDLNVLRSLTLEVAELNRLIALLELEHGTQDNRDGGHVGPTKERLEASQAEIARLISYLESSGWDRSELEGDSP